MNPLLWIACDTFVSASEVWLYRQAIGMRRHNVKILTWSQLDREQFPAKNCSIQLIPNKLNLPVNGWKRRIGTRLPNLARGYWGSTASETKWFQSQIRSERPSAILAQYGTNGLRVLPAARAEKVPVVVHFHGFDLSALLSSWYYRASLRRALPHVHRCIVVAEYMETELLDLGCSVDKITKIPCGVPINEFVASSGAARSECRFLMVGRLTEKKRPDLSIQAFAMVAANHPKARLVVVGDGILMPAVRDAISKCGITDQVELLGAQPPERVRTEMSRASVFIQHSVTSSKGDKEGWPVSIAEAAASGLPIVSTRHASIPEQVCHGESGFLCDEGDWRLMGQYMIQLAGDAALRKQMGEAGRAHISKFDTSRQIALLEDVLASAAQTNG